MDNMTKSWRLLVKMVVVLVGRLERKLFEEKKKFNIVYRLTAEACTNLQDLMCRIKISCMKNSLVYKVFQLSSDISVQSWIW